MTALTVFLPLIGFLVTGILGSRLGDRGANMITCGLMILSALCASVVFLTSAGGEPYTVELATWISSGAFDVSWALYVDTLSAAMMFTVTVISAAVHVYSIGYMHHDPTVPRFMAYLSLFTFFMLMLVTADNLVQMFFGWEGVGVASYLLIGYWYDRPSANAAAIKAFLVNRVGDVGFALGIFGVFLMFDTVSLQAIFTSAPDHAEATFQVFGMQVHALTAICVLLFIGAMGKSAQIGLHTWLPDAMEGPTPVSALIHAATMVTAGVFMVCRMSPLFELAEGALVLVTLVGAVTAFFAATVGCVQTDIKRVIAYSTCSQLGYMFFAAGVGAYQAAMFHLVTHAFFKALLFLAAGSVIHAMSDEQDMRRMGGLWQHIRKTYVLMWIGSLALAGLPFFAGFYSKDMILEAAWGAHSGIGMFAFWMGILAAFMTAFYSWRLLFMTFHGEPRADEKTMAHVHESPPVMLWPLYVLAFGAVFAGMIGYHAFVGEGREAFWGAAIAVVGTDPVEAAHHVPFLVKVLPILVSLGGIWLAYTFYVRTPDLANVAAQIFRPVYLFMLNKWYFDELYDRIFVRPAFFIGHGLWKTGDGTIIDGLGPDGVASTTRALARRVAALQTGYIYHYAFVMIIGLTLAVTVYFVFVRG